MLVPGHVLESELQQAACSLAGISRDEQGLDACGHHLAVQCTFAGKGGLLTVCRPRSAHMHVSSVIQARLWCPISKQQPYRRQITADTEAKVRTTP